MDKVLYFDIVSDEWAGGLYLLTDDLGQISFYYHRSLSDLEDESKNTSSVSETYYPGFEAFWKQFITNNRWFTFHPLYIHPEQRAFIRTALSKVNWTVIPDEKWRDMYQRQWNKVLTSPAEYYKPQMP